MRSRNKIRADLILICALLLISGGLLLLLNAVNRSGEKVVVYRDGERIAEYPLQEERELLLKSGNGGTNILRISDGEADMVDADCPDRTCVGMHAIRHVGETIICLPHRLEIRIEGEKEPEVDVP